MLTTAKANVQTTAVVIGPARWRDDARRAWSFAVYYVGFRLLAIQMSCGSWAVSGMPLVVKYAAG